MDLQIVLLMKRQTKKLALRIEAVRNLGMSELANAIGGRDTKLCVVLAYPLIHATSSPSMPAGGCEPVRINIGGCDIGDVGGRHM